MSLSFAARLFLLPQGYFFCCEVISFAARLYLLPQQLYDIVVHCSASRHTVNLLTFTIIIIQLQLGAIPVFSPQFIAIDAWFVYSKGEIVVPVSSARNGRTQY